MKKNRNASIELLRFISAFMIVLSHSSVHGGFKIFSNPTIFNNTLLRLVNLGRFRNNKFSNKYFRYMTLIVSIVFILGFVYIFSSKQIFDNFQPNMDFDEYVKQSSFVMNRLSPLILLLGVSLLTIFTYGKEINNNFILFLGASSLPIYLAHDNNISRNIIWRTIFNNTAYYESNSLIFRLILSAILVVIAALLIEFLRKIIGQLFNSIWGKIKLTK